MNAFSLVVRSLRFHWRAHAGAMLGAAVAATVLTGALLTGDSVRHSLRTYALMRLGPVSVAMDSGNRFFSDALAGGVKNEAGAEIAAVLKLEGSVMDADESRQVNRARILGVDEVFWRLAGCPAPDLAENEIAINEKLAAELPAAPGDRLFVRMRRPGLLPRDAPLSSRKDRLSSRLMFTVKRVVRDAELGRFSLEATQQAPRNVFMNRSRLQAAAGLDGRSNLLLAGGADSGADSLQAAMRRAWRPEYSGIRLSSFPDLGVLQLESDRVFLDPAMARAALGVKTAGVRAAPVGILAYLVNSISAQTEAGERSTPYSFVIAASPSDSRALSPVPAGMQDNEIIVNRWLADRLAAKAGDAVAVAYYEMTPTGDFVEKSRRFTVHSVIEMSALQGERRMMPKFPGLSDVDSCRDWDIGLPTDEAKLKDEANEAYWKEYRDTPKALVTLEAGREMWANRFGDLSAARFEAGPDAGAAIARQLGSALDPSDLGFFFVPVRINALNAVEQAMDFGQLFTGMSMFLIVAALILASLVFAFGVERRSQELGLLLAAGWPRSRVRRQFLAEGCVLAAAGSIVGAGLGSVYARAVIWGLRTHWRGAVANSVILYNGEWSTLFGGALASFVCGFAAVGIAAWRQSRFPIHTLLVGDFAAGPGPGPGPARTGAGAAWPVLLLCAGLGVIVYAVASEAASPALPFFAAGALLLIAGLGFCRLLFVRLGRISRAEPSSAGLSVGNAARRRGRSLAVIGLLASGSFLVFAVSSMNEDPGAHAAERRSGAGGFSFFGESTLPIMEDLNTERGRKSFSLDDSSLAGVLPTLSRTVASRAGPVEGSFVQIKAHDGDDASCFNLNRAQAPRLLGVDPTDFISRGAFVPEGDASGLWDLLNEELADGSVPGLVGDSDTATWGLKKKTGVRGDTLSYRDERGAIFKVKLVGKLPMRVSVFQGAVLISARAFTERFPSEPGWRVLLVDAPPDQANRETAALIARLFSGVGLDIVPCRARLAGFLGVQATYLAMFTVLGGLGLLLGSAGFGIVLLRNVMERRGELALLRAVGFSRRWVKLLILGEHCFLWLAGLAYGIVAALVAIAPALESPNIELPWAWLGCLAGGLLICGASFALLAVEAATRGNLLGALRSEPN